MADHWTDQFSFVNAAVRNRDLTYVALVGDEAAGAKIPQTIFVAHHKGQWLKGADRNWNVGGMAVSRKPLEQLIGIGEWGQVLCFGSGDVHDEHVTGGQKGPQDRGPLRSARRIGESIYVSGMDRQVYRRDASGRWADIGPRPAADGETAGFEGIAGFDERNVYAVGWEGEIWKYDGSAWTQLPSATNLVLVDVCCAGDGNVYACGRKGLLLRGRDQAWTVIDTDDLREDLWSLAWYGERLYVATMYGVYTLGPAGLAPVDFGADPPESCYRLATADDRLWSIGAKDIMAFDGKQWTRID